MIVIAVAGLFVVKGKLANLVIHGTVKVEDIDMVVIRKGLTSFRPAWCVGSGLRPIIVAKLCFLIFFQLVGIVVMDESFLCFVTCQFTAEVSTGSIFRRVAFLFAVDYRISVTALR